MSTTIAKNYQVGSDGTATNNFTIRQPATPDGTVRIANGNSGTTTDLVTVTSAGNVGVGTTSPATKFQVSAGRTTLSANNENFALQLNNGSSTNGPFLGSSGLDTLVVSASSGAERMRLDSSGNLGLGVTPSAWISSGKAIDIAGFGSVAQTSSGSLASTFNAYQNSAGNWIYKTTNAAAQYQCGLAGLGQHAWFVAPSGTAGNSISFTQAMTLDATGDLALGRTAVTTIGNGYRTIDMDGSNGSGIRFRSNGTNVGYVYVAGTSNLDLGTVGAYPITFTTNGSERARITSGGYLLVGTTSGIVAQTGVTSTHNISTNVDTGFGLTVSNTSGGAFGLGIKYTAHSPNNAGNSFVWCSDGGGTQRASIYSNGGLANYSGNNVNLSDRREKTNFAPAKDYLDTICAIPVQTFNYIDQSEDDPGTTLGVVAQDVQAVAPELVMESNWGTKEDPKMRLSIYQTDLQYALMKCIQELKAELDSVKTELALLKGTA